MTTDTPAATPGAEDTTAALQFLAQCAQDHSATLAPASRLALVDHANRAINTLRLALAIPDAPQVPVSNPPPAQPSRAPQRKRR
jgi:hypothetical protein